MTQNSTTLSSLSGFENGSFVHLVAVPESVVPIEVSAPPSTSRSSTRAQHPDAIGRGYFREDDSMPMRTAISKAHLVSSVLVFYFTLHLVQTLLVLMLASSRAPEITPESESDFPSPPNATDPFEELEQRPHFWAYLFVSLGVSSLGVATGFTGVYALKARSVAAAVWFARLIVATMYAFVVSAYVESTTDLRAKRLSAEQRADSTVALWIILVVYLFVFSTCHAAAKGLIQQFVAEYANDEEGIGDDSPSSISNPTPVVDVV